MNFDLEKKRDTVFDLLKKKGVNTAPVMRVGGAVDISFSMQNIINEGRAGNKLQQTLNQLMGPALTFDDNGEIDMFKFDDRCDYVGTCGPDNYADFVAKRGIRVRGGTAYTPIIEAAQDYFFGGSPKTVVEPAKKGFFGFGSKPAVTTTVPPTGDNTPVLMMIVTDGEVSSSDRNACEKALRAAVNTPIYYHFVGVGGGERNFPTIHYLADALPNVGEVYLPSFGMSDEEVYEQLICDELVEFIGKFSSNRAVSA